MIRFAPMAMTGVHHWIRYLTQRCGKARCHCGSLRCRVGDFAENPQSRSTGLKGTEGTKRDQSTTFRRNRKSQEGLSNVVRVFRVAISQA
jgi:hypothetical protein